MKLAGVVIALAACSGGAKGTRPGTDPTVAEVIDRLAKARAELASFRGDSTMDYWLGGQRAKGEVLVMGKVGSKVRFAALSPAGGSTMAEMACDGASFVYVDYQNNCALTGPCDSRSIAQFFGIELAPDDFVHLALGTPPVVADAKGTVTWDGGAGVERVALEGASGKQKLAINTKDATAWDVIDSELSGSDGKVRWSVANTDFKKVDGSGTRRVPGKSRFKSPAQSQDLLVEWTQLEVNVELEDDKFKLAVPPGLATCGHK